MTFFTSQSGVNLFPREQICVTTSFRNTHKDLTNQSHWFLLALSPFPSTMKRKAWYHLVHKMRCIAFKLALRGCGQTSRWACIWTFVHETLTRFICSSGPACLSHCVEWGLDWKIALWSRQRLSITPDGSRKTTHLNAADYCNSGLANPHSLA